MLLIHLITIQTIVTKKLVGREKIKLLGNHSDEWMQWLFHKISKSCIKFGIMYTEKQLKCSKYLANIVLTFLLGNAIQYR